ncbi:MAG: phenylalanine--tRNA ligase subunit beta [Flavobacteriales bacterium]|nr:phenylalanine--tRNA ligase subunit beta [Flavobacteriales bacterium]MCB9167463.1 phenylalanine--tRNA ligase subunit beta [Flavobacteriales bacterium]
MRISWNWLRTLIDLDIGPERAAALLTNTGLEVEHLHREEPIKGMLAGVVVGHVLSCGKHPDADRLQVCMVDLGTGAAEQIVCGAPNVAEGQKVLVATVGSMLYMADGTALTIKKAKIRGVESRGMICAEDELGLGGGHEGIIVLDANARTGAPAAEHLGLRSDVVFEIGLTPNRADAMGHLGVARDLAAAATYREGLSAQVRTPDVSAFRPGGAGPVISVTVEAEHVCPRYAGLTLRNVRMGPSPEWMQERLRSIGLRPINAVVDVTNYVMHELGQPLHAFDADRIHEGRIVVRHLSEGTPFTTLDGKERRLSAEDLMITDPEGGLCIAGVYGGLHSGVTDGTSRIFLESACFDAVSIRRTARRHALNTDASFRFERGVDPGITVVALKRAALLLQEIADAEVVGEMVDIHPHPFPHREVTLDPTAVDRLLGTEIAVDHVRRILELLDYEVKTVGGSSKITVGVPPYRTDVHREVDLIEEVLRIHGQDRVPLPERLSCPSVPVKGTDPALFRQRLGTYLAARGFQEVMTSSLVNGAQMHRLGVAGEKLIRLRNPLSAEMDVMRPSLLHGLLAVAGYNTARQRPDLRLFEQGRTYAPGPIGGPHVETDRTALLITGALHRESWREGPRPAELDDIRQEIEELLGRMLVSGDRSWSMATDMMFEAAAEVRDREGGVLARVGRVAPAVSAVHDLRGPCLYAELDELALSRAVATHPTGYQEVPRFPAVRRDLSLLIDSGVQYVEIERVARQAERGLLREMVLFDVYEGEKLQEGKKSYAVGFVLQDPTRTLTDAEVDRSMGRIQAALEEQVGARLR